MEEQREIMTMMCEDKEIWVDIEGYNGMYQVSQFGRVRSWKNGTSKRKADSPRLLSLMNDGRGYLHVTIPQTKTVHRLVASAFIANPQNLPYVDHIDGDRTNNDVSNLRWVSCYQSLLNTKKPKDNKSGYKGVFCEKRTIGKNTYEYWYAFWSENGEKKRERFYTSKEAIEHRRKMEKLHYSQEHYIYDR